MLRFVLCISFVLMGAAFSGQAFADHACSKARQSKIDDVIKEETERKGAAVAEEGDLVRIIFMEDNREENKIARIVTLYTKPTHPQHPIVVQRKMFDSPRFYMTINKGWTATALPECAAMLSKLVVDEGSNDDDDAYLVEKGR